MSTKTQAHTPGPLQATKAPMSRAGKYAENDHLIYTLDNLHVAEVFQYQGEGHAHAPAEANAHRIVASWNACEGIPTEALEAGVVADLLKACEAALRYDASILGRAAVGNVDLLRTGLGVAEGEDLDTLYEDWMSKAHAAVAKAKGVSP